MSKYSIIRRALANMDAAAAHAASGASRPKVDEIFAPEHHAGALDPNTVLVLGARGAGKSFWAGVLGDDETRAAAAEAYPNLRLGETKVKFGFTGLTGDGSVSKATLDAQVPLGEERARGTLFWRCVMMRALQSAVAPDVTSEKISVLMVKYADPEDWEEEFSRLAALAEAQKCKVIVLFDALDGLATDWERLRDLIDALLAAAWEVRGYKAVRAKLFLRPDQVRDLSLRFVELPKLLAGATNLVWTREDLYGMFFARLGQDEEKDVRDAFDQILKSEGVASAPRSLRELRSWQLSHDERAQAKVFVRLAGTYMGRSNKKGRTYDWPINHLADGHGEVTPRSFMTLIIAAARVTGGPANQVIHAEGIRIGLREASKVRVNQLDLEFPWIKRVLAPLAGMQVPADLLTINNRWRHTSTIESVTRRALDGEFLPPYDPKADGSPTTKLVGRLIRIGILILRNDRRYDMPDLFRVAARLLKKGGVAPA